jgi:flagellin-like protein
MKWPSSRKGVSEIIAAMLLVCIVLSAGILLAGYASGLMGHIQMAESQPYTEQLTLDYYSWPCPNGNCNSGSPGSLTMIIRNDGAATITLADFFMQGMKNTSDVTPSSCLTLQLYASCTLTFPVPSGLTVTQGIAYTVKLVAKDGTLFAFSCVYGSYTH